MEEDAKYHRPGFMFWATAPFLVGLVAAIPFLVTDWDSTKAAVATGLSSLCVLVFLGLLHPIRFWWAWRAVGALVFGFYLLYLVDMLVASDGGASSGGRRSEPSALNALIGLIAFGAPGLIYAIFGRLTPWLPLDEAEDNPLEWEDDDAIEGD